MTPDLHSDPHAERRQRVLNLVKSRRVGSQQELVELLRAQGVEASQSSVFRDLRSLGVGKVGGRYVAPPEPHAAEAAPDELEEAARFIRAIKPAGPNLTVVLCGIGTAQRVALAIDDAGFPECVGTVAGDDTLFVATASAHDQSRLIARLSRLASDLHPPRRGN